MKSKYHSIFSARRVSRHAGTDVKEMEFFQVVLEPEGQQFGFVSVKRKISTERLHCITFFFFANKELPNFQPCDLATTHNLSVTTKTGFNI